MKKVIISILVIVVFIALFRFLTTLDSNDIEGEITIEIVDINGDVESGVYGFVIEDTLFSILNENFNVKCANSSYQIADSCQNLLFNSKVILQINDVETNWFDNFIAIYENDSYSNSGIDSIVLNDQDYFRFEYQEVGD